MELAGVAVVGVPPGVEVVVGAAGVVGVQGLRLLRLCAVDDGVVVGVGAVEGDFAVTEDEEAVDVAVGAFGDVGVKLGEGGCVEAEGGGVLCVFGGDLRDRRVKTKYTDHD